MSAPHGQNCHPRRRPIKGQVSPLSTHGMSLRKSGTFSSPKSLVNEICGLDNQPFMPRRSPTSPESLEALIDQQPTVRRVVDLLKDFDEKIAGHKAGASILADPEVLPVPSFVLDSATLDGSPMDIDTHNDKSAVVPSPHDHASDSGLGASISELKQDPSPRRTRGSASSIISSTHSAVTRSGSTLSAPKDNHTLSEHACRQIRETIIDPILAEDTLKDFHSLIKDVPRRIGEKSICNLRDLEKTLLFLAPGLSATATSYLRFCERTIQLLHTTVQHISEQDQRLPSDRPYTNNYFLDLIEQIRRYAAIMAATRQKEANGQDLDEMDYSRDEKITLRGGLSHNGQPMELVREKNGEVISIVEGTDATTKIAKRSFSERETDDEEAIRSMARRRKSDKAGDVILKCDDCDKTFERNCDLTKHKKTHSRPWKCTVENCTYAKKGWPTEKERDRHMNDKHSANPPQHKCLFHPCVYSSKRESNLKQHMEKAHNWTYVRSKNNSRKNVPTKPSQSPPTPFTPFEGTPLSAALTTPITPFMHSPSVPMADNFGNFYGLDTPAMSVQGFQNDNRRDSAATNGSYLTYSSGHSSTELKSFEDAFTPEENTISHGDLLSGHVDEPLFTTMPFLQQQPAPPVRSTFDFDPLSFTNMASNAMPTNNMAHNNVANAVPRLSPMGQPDLTLFDAGLDEGFGEMDMDMQMFSRPTEDFTLFDTAQGNMSINNTANFFPEFNELGGQFDNMEATTTLDDLAAFNFRTQ